MGYALQSEGFPNGAESPVKRIGPRVGADLQTGSLDAHVCTGEENKLLAARISEGLEGGDNGEGLMFLIEDLKINIQKSPLVIYRMLNS